MSDTLPFHQTLSIVSFFLLCISTSMMLYTMNQSTWMFNKVSVETYPAGVALNNSIPVVPGDKKHNCGGFMRNLANVLMENKSGKLYLDVGVGLKEFCAHLRLKKFGPMSDMLPQMHYCKPHSVLNEKFGLSRIKWDDRKYEKKLFDDVIDTIDEVSDLMTAAMSILIVATFSSLLKTPLISNFLKNRKIFQALTFILILAAAIATTWGIALFYQNFDPKTLIETEKRHQIINKHAETILKTLKIDQKLGKCFWLVTASDGMLALVMVLSFFEYRFARGAKHGVEEQVEENPYHKPLLDDY